MSCPKVTVCQCVNVASNASVWVSMLIPYACIWQSVSLSVCLLGYFIEGAIGLFVYIVSVAPSRVHGINFSFFAVPS